VSIFDFFFPKLLIITSFYSSIKNGGGFGLGLSDGVKKRVSVSPLNMEANPY
jgi:hypothetical protein